MSLNRIAILVGALIVLIIAVWAFVNLRPLLGDLFGGNKGTVVVNGETFTVSLADTPEKQTKGLSGKRSLPTDQGMLFVFPEAGTPSFWMKEMQFPLDIIFINATTVTTVYDNVPPPADKNAPLQVYKPTAPSDKVLELNGGQAAQLGIKPGTVLEITFKK